MSINKVMRILHIKFTKSSLTLCGLKKKGIKEPKTRCAVCIKCVKALISMTGFSTKNFNK